MVQNFKSRETEKIFHRQISRKLPQAIHQVALRKLRMLNRATTLNDLRVPPGNQLEKLTKDQAGQHSIRLNNHRLKTEGLNSSTKSTDTGHFRPV